MTTKAAALPSRTYECCPCEITYLAGAKAGAGPFACDECGAVLTLRPDGAEPYASGASLVENIVAAPVEQMEMRL